jgi:predicted dehydrogenase
VSGIRLGVLGAGIMGQRVAQAARDSGRFTVTAVADVDPARADALAAQFGATAFPDADRLLAGMPVDAVYIGLPHHLHLPACLAAGVADVHVLVDKPLCNTLREAEQIQAVAKASGRAWVVGFSYRFRSEWRRAQEVIASGEIGEPYFVVDVITEAAESLPGWYWDAASGGGILQLQAHHSFDRIGWLVGREPTRLAASTVGSPGGVARSAQVSVDYPGPVAAGISLSFGLGYAAPPATLCVVHAEDGLVQLDADRTLRIVTPAGRRLERHTRDDWLGRELHAFADAIDGRADGVPTVEDGIRALRCAVLAERAAALGTWVSVDG